MSAPLKVALQAFAETQKETADKPQLIFKAVSGLDILHLGGWKDNMAALRSAIGKSCDLKVGKFSGAARASENKDFTLLPLAFEKYRLLGKRHNLPKPLLELPAEIGVALSVSHSFCLLQISGAMVRDFLPLLLTINTADDAFTAGAFATTSYHHAAVSLHRSALQPEHYTLHLPAGTAQSLCETILEVAAQFPIKIDI